MDVIVDRDGDDPKIDTGGKSSGRAVPELTAVLTAGDRSHTLGDRPPLLSREAGGYLSGRRAPPSFGRYQIILPDDRGTCVNSCTESLRSHAPDDRESTVYGEDRVCRGSCTIPIPTGVGVVGPQRPQIFGT